MFSGLLLYNEAALFLPWRLFMVGSLGKVFVLKTTDRATGVLALLKKLDLADYSEKRVAFKANFNSVDSFPSSHHLDSL